MKALGRRETAMQIDQAIETRRAARSIADGEPELSELPASVRDFG